MLSEAKEMASQIASSLPQTVDGFATTDKSKIPFKLLSLRELLLHRISALASPAVQLFENREHVAAVVLVRAVIETVALLFSLHRQLKAFQQSEDVEALDHFLTSGLLASRWEDAPYPARSILTFIDHIDRELPGFRATYDSLSEFAHPNWCGVFEAFGQVVPAERLLKLGPSDRTTVFESGISALCGSLAATKHYYNNSAELIAAANEYFESRSNVA